MSPGYVFPRQRGFSLIEVVLAIGLLAFALVAIVGLLAVGVDAGSTSKEMVVAASIASQAIAERRHSPDVDATGLLLPPATATGTGEIFVSSTGQAVADAANAEYRLSWNYSRPATDLSKVTFVTVSVHWPAVADPANAEALVLSSAIALPPGL